MTDDKNWFIKTLADKTGETLETCTAINSILEDHFIIGKNNQAKIEADFVKKLNFTPEKADEIYNASMELIAKHIKNRVCHPFKKRG